MLINRTNFRLHRFWFTVFLLGAVASVFCLRIEFAPLSIRSPGGSTLTGLLCGVIAAALILFECFLWPRKRLLRTWRIGRMRTWMIAHIWLGLLTLPFALAHAGVAWGGALGQCLMAFYALVMISGVFGLLMQQWLPSWLLESVPEETIYSQIEVVAASNLEEADALVAAVCGIPIPDWSEAGLATAAAVDANSGEVVVGSTRESTMLRDRTADANLPPEPIENTVELLRAYASSIRPHLDRPGGMRPLQDEREASVFFSDIRTRTSPAAGAAIERLEHWCRQRRQFGRQARIHFWLHAWLAVHLPLSIALLILLAWHVVVALKYSGNFSLY